MAFQPVPNTAVADIVFSLHGQNVENVIHVTKTSPWSAADLASLAANIIAWWKANIRPITSVDLVLQRVETRDLSSEGGAFASVDCTTECGGQDIGLAQPGNVTVAIGLRTARAGRNYRGRLYHLGLTEAQTVGNVLAAGLAVTLDTAYTALLNTLTGLGWQWVVVSRVLDGVQRPVGVATPITNVSVDSNLDSQRRRLQGRGT